MKSILVLEDSTGARVWLASVLLEVFPETHIYEAATIAEAKQIISEHNINLAIIDIGLPDGNGTDFVRFISATTQQTYIVMATIFDDDHHIFEALKSGAHGYLLKDQPRTDFVEKLQGILRGNPPLSPSVGRRILRYFNQITESDNVSPLSKREEDVLVLIARGYKCKEASEILGLSQNTVAGYTKSIYHKLNVSSRAEAALEANRLGLISV